MQKLRRSSPTPLDDDAALLLMARQLLGGPRDDGRASYQIVLSVCPACGQGRQQASGELVPVGADVVAMADCDGQHLEPIQARDTGDGVPCGSTDASTGRSVVAKRDVENDAHTGVVPTTVHSLRLAKQAIPPATRRAVLRRDHQCCAVPGCRNSRYLDIHHIQPRSAGGENDADNLIALCGAHHRAAHRGELEVTGRVSTAVHFRHADGKAYGQVTAPGAVENQVKVFAALRRLGFREGETRQVLAQLSASGRPRDTTLEGVLREALAELTTSGESVQATCKAL